MLTSPSQSHGHSIPGNTKRPGIIRASASRRPAIPIGSHGSEQTGRSWQQERILPNVVVMLVTMQGLDPVSSLLGSEGCSFAWLLAWQLKWPSCLPRVQMPSRCSDRAARCRGHWCISGAAKEGHRIGYRMMHPFQAVNEFTLASIRLLAMTSQAMVCLRKTWYTVPFIASQRPSALGLHQRDTTGVLRERRRIMARSKDRRSDGSKGPTIPALWSEWILLL